MAADDFTLHGEAEADLFVERIQYGYFGENPEVGDGLTPEPDGTKPLIALLRSARARLDENITRLDCQLRAVKS